MMLKITRFIKSIFRKQESHLNYEEKEARSFIKNMEGRKVTFYICKSACVSAVYDKSFRANVVIVEEDRFIISFFPRHPEVIEEMLWITADYKYAQKTPFGFIFPAGANSHIEILKK